MARFYIIVTLLLAISVFLLGAGCEKEKIVETTEYIHDIEYVELPSDTVYQVDSIFIDDSIIVNLTDTIHVHDTIFQDKYVYDTIAVHDTVTTIEYLYDTTVVTDTVMMSQCEPNEHLAIAALQYYSDDLVIEYIYQEFGYNDGWVFYLSSFQLGLEQQSSDVYDIYGFIDYWTSDWSGYYPLEFYWRLTHTGGDPANPENWEMTDPPSFKADYQPGLRLILDPDRGQPGRN
jgi:hypothetical protein